MILLENEKQIPRLCRKQQMESKKGESGLEGRNIDIVDTDCLSDKT